MFAPSQHDAYSGSSFPGLVDSLFNIDQVSSEEEDERWTVVRKQLAAVTYFLQAASVWLSETDKF